MVLAVALALPARAQSLANADIPTTWPNVSYRITQLQKIPGDRLLVTVCVHALTTADPSGTLIGIQVPIPPGTPAYVIATGAFRPHPLSIDGATMTDERTKQVYNTVKPDGKGPHYVSSTIITILHPGQGGYMTIQFPYPPPPPVEPGSPLPPPPKVSILIPKASGPITGLVLP